MFKLINDILQKFQVCFKRKFTFNWFVIIVFGMMIRPDFRGVTSIVGALMIDPEQYRNILHFFRSTAYKLDNIKICWLEIVMDHIEIKQLQGYLLAIGDHSKIVKEARYMPAVKKHHQESENSGKVEYIYGHEFGMAGLLSKSMQCIPVDIAIHNGIDDVNLLSNSNVDEKDKQTYETEKETGKKLSSAKKMMNMFENVVNLIKKPILVLLDAGFAVGDVFKQANKINEKAKSKIIAVIARAKNNYVAYEKAKESPQQRRGNKSKDGEKFILSNLFSEKIEDFKTSILNIYGKQETVKYLCLDLFWDAADSMIRFVFVKTGDKKMILMCSDLTLDPEMIITAYTYRFKIEVAFKQLKHSLGSFCYHFWTKAMPKLSKFKTKVDFGEVTDKVKIDKILSAVQAIEVFTFLGCIAFGLLSIVASEFPNIIWRNFSGWMRTSSSAIPSIETTRISLQKLYILNKCKVAKYATFAIIEHFQKEELYTYDEYCA